MKAPIPNTQRKLRETAYYLRLLEQKAAMAAHDPEEILYLLSAFLSAGRSVTLILQAEQKKAYDSWFPKWHAGLTCDRRDLFDAMNHQRVAELHSTGAEVESEPLYVPVTQTRTGDPGHPAYGFHWWGPPGTSPPKVGWVQHFLNLGSAPAPLAQSCLEYFRLLEQAVLDFQAFIERELT